ncbi:hypothetical protein ACHMW4_04225 [Mesorhizobium sp. UC22_110]|uniref:hypothetical protein n=1 Tax=unclassified Mesorhizobium TaxID=325217 RepID=UPI003670AF3E
MSWSDAFANYTTGMAFHIALSHDQASMVVYLGFKGEPSQWQSRSGRGTFIPTVKALIKRGLVEHNPMIGTRLPSGVKVKWIYRLTPAGEHVFYLLKFAGLADHQPIRSQQVAA